MRTGVLLIAGPPFCYDTRLRMRSVNMAGHYSLLARLFDNYTLAMILDYACAYLTGSAPMTDNNLEYCCVACSYHINNRVSDIEYNLVQI